MTGGMSKSERSYHHGDLRAGLMARAIEVIGESGLDAVSLRALARDLGVSHAAPARHFASSDDLLRAIAVEGIGSMRDAVKAAVAKADDDPTARLAAVGTAHLDWALANPAHYRALRNPEVTRKAEDEIFTILSEVVAIVREAMVEAQKEGWHADSPLRIELFRFASAINGAAILVTNPMFERLVGGTGREMYDDLLERLLA